MSNTSVRMDDPCLSPSQKLALVKLMRKSRYSRAVLAKERHTSVRTGQADIEDLITKFGYAERKVDNYRVTYPLTDAGKIRAGKVVMELFIALRCKFSLTPRRGNGIYEPGARVNFNFG